MARPCWKLWSAAISLSFHSTDQRQWWRYHHLFAEVLQAHLKEAQADRVTEIHRRASVWYEQHDLLADAIHHALAAKEFDRAAGLIEAGRTSNRGWTYSVGCISRLAEGAAR